MLVTFYLVLANSKCIASRPQEIPGEIYVKYHWIRHGLHPTQFNWRELCPVLVLFTDNHNKLLSKGWALTLTWKYIHVIVLYQWLTWLALAVWVTKRRIRLQRKVNQIHRSFQIGHRAPLPNQTYAAVDRTLVDICTTAVGILLWCSTLLQVDTTSTTEII